MVLAILGPSGVGKSTTRANLSELDKRFTVVPAWTTRPRRDSDIDRIHVSDEDFDRAYSEESFLPSNEVYGARYATPKGLIWAALDRGDFPLLDWPIGQLADLRRAFPGRTFAVYLLPPSTAELQRRLRLDGRDEGGQRFRSAMRELEEFHHAGHDARVDMILVSKTDRESDTARFVYNAFMECMAGKPQLIAGTL